MEQSNNEIKRYERKWVYKGQDNLQIINALIRSKFFFNFQYTNRQVNSIYFDDAHYSSIRENLDSVSQKEKYRIRWYGNKTNLNNAQLEIKRKIGFETTKKIKKIDKLKNLNILNDESLNSIENFTNDTLNLKKKIIPLLTTHYNREYFVSNNKLIRATLDHNLESYDLRINGNKDILKNYYNNKVLEIKYDISLDNFVRENLKTISVRLSKNSKFVNSAIEEAFFYN